MSKTQNILDMIRQKRSRYTDEQLAERKKQREWEESFRRAPVSADDWQEFKRKFIAEYGGEKVQSTGMTHSEFLRYMKDSYREGVEEKGLITSQSLRDFLKNNC
jgi:hypothetical protein